MSRKLTVAISPVTSAQTSFTILLSKRTVAVLLIIFSTLCVKTSSFGHLALKASFKGSPRRGRQMSSSLKAYSFGPFTIPPSTVFYETPLTFAFVNLRPIVPGHVLICPKRPSLLLKDLTHAEYSDLWATVRAVQAVVEESKGAGGSNVAVQDGPEAGQSVKHVHVHVLPRVGGDFEVRNK